MPRKRIKDLLFIDLLIILLFVLALRMQPSLAFAAVVLADLYFFLWLAAPNIAADNPALRRKISAPEEVGRFDFHSTITGNTLFFFSFVFLCITGIIMMSPEGGMSNAQASVFLLAHFLLGIAVVVVLLFYLVARVHYLLKNAASWRRGLLDLIVDFFAGLAIFLFFMFVTQLMPVILIYLLTFGSACLIVLLFAVIYVKKRKRFQTAGEWMGNWAGAATLAPFVVLFLFLFGYNRFGSHFSNADVQGWHCEFAKFIGVIVLLTPMLFILHSVFLATHWKKVRALASGLARYFGTLFLVVVGMLFLKQIPATWVFFIKIREFLLPLPPGH